MRRSQAGRPGGPPHYARIEVTHFMPALTFEQLLDRAASSRGIEPGFWDIWGHYHTTTTEAKQAILRGLGFAAENREELERSLAALTRREWERLLPPAVVRYCQVTPLPGVTAMKALSAPETRLSRIITPAFDHGSTFCTLVTRAIMVQFPVTAT